MDGLIIGVIHKVHNVAVLSFGGVDGVLLITVSDTGALLAYYLTEGSWMYVGKDIIPKDILACSNTGFEGIVAPDYIALMADYHQTHGQFVEVVFLLSCKDPCG